MTPLTPRERQAKLHDLLDTTEFLDIMELAQAAIFDSTSPAICTAPDCDHTDELEKDQDRGFCNGCHRNTMVSALVLAGLI